jgi:hypothetical protein
MGDALTAMEVFQAIAHGDDDHREWLKEALFNLFAGEPVPPPRGLNIPKCQHHWLAVPGAMGRNGLAEITVAWCPDCDTVKTRTL